MSLLHLLTEKVLPEHSSMYDKINHFLESKGYDVEYLSRGTTAFIFQVKDKKKAIRLSYKTKRDLEIYDAVKEHDFTNVVKIYYSRVFENDTEQVLISVQELLDDVPIHPHGQYLNKVYLVYHESITDMLHNEPFTVENVFRAFKNYYHRRFTDKELEWWTKLVLEDPRNKYIQQILNGVKELDDIGYIWRDRHAGNIMYDKATDQLKIIDLGDYRRK